MAESRIRHRFSLPPPPLLPPLPLSSISPGDPPPSPPLSSTPPTPFDPSRMIGIIRRKVLIKDLAAVYHAECLTYCQELLELQSKLEDPFRDEKTQEESRKEMTKPPKRLKKFR
ncbi:Hypothetical predicted protein [Olea europaea subsp. europaea]|uniref:Uncharacterized protein n=1 Tax=Olea europaea subsp. europaea TaxID=158383 RepID=A0A8S0PX99_OLEEU|nr:Hypothetical predicted protein [Olea europaea subsp. europaea]